MQQAMLRDPRRAAKERVPAAKPVTANGQGSLLGQKRGGKEVAELSWSPATQLLMLPGCFPNGKTWASAADD